MNTSKLIKFHPPLRVIFFVFLTQIPRILMRKQVTHQISNHHSFYYGFALHVNMSALTKTYDDSVCEEGNRTLVPHHEKPHIVSLLKGCSSAQPHLGVKQLWCLKAEVESVQ